MKATKHHLLDPDAHDTTESARPTPTLMSAVNSDSESDAYVGSKRQILTKKQRLHQLQVAAGLAAPSQAEVRFSGRATRKVTNYNEDDHESFEDEASDTFTPNYGASTVDESLPRIGIALKHRLKESSGLSRLMTNRTIA